MKTTPNSNIKRFLIAASVALAIPLSAAAFGGHGDRGGCSMEAHGGPAHSMMPRHLRGLNLTDAQQDKVFEIMHAQAPVMRSKANTLRKIERDLRALTAAPEYSDAKAQVLADMAAKATSEMTLARAKADRQVFEVLTPEQRKQLADMKPMERGPRGAADSGKPAGR